MNDTRILLAHGSGGLLSHQLVEEVFAAAFDNPILAPLDDAAVLAEWGEHAAGPLRLAFTTDSYVVRPLDFPGGDIGRLALCGTVNDLAMVGATPLYISAAFILEEGFPLADLRRYVASMRTAAEEAGVRIVAGDTKVVERGGADGLFINTAGVGVVPAGVRISGANACPGDVVLLSGAVGDHGLAVMSQREGLHFAAPIHSDCAPLNVVVAALLRAIPGAVHALRDPTRGGLATTLCELAQASGVGVEVEEAAIPVHEAVRGAGEMLGLDPLFVANEGKFVAVVAAEAAAEALAVLHQHVVAREAVQIGRVTAEHPGQVVLRTSYGASRLLQMPAGELLPRIC